MMSKNTKFKSWEQKVKCRVCGEILKEKNYECHLIRKHKEEPAGDKRTYGQQSISTFLANAAQKNISISSPSQDSENDKNESNVEGEVGESRDTPEDGSFTKEEQVPIDQKLEQISVDQKLEQIPVDQKLEQILEEIKTLQNKVERLEEARNNYSSSSTNNIKAETPSSTNISYVFQSCRSISDIVSFFNEFEFDEKTSVFRCRICVPHGNLLPERKGYNSHPAIFVYEVDHGTDFPAGCILPAKFRNLKSHLKEHLLSKMHFLSVESKEKVEKEEKELESKEKQVGMRIGRIAYRLYFKARPYSDFEDEIALNVQNGCYMGDINHSVAFAKNFLPYVSDVVRQHLKKFLNDALLQTGFQPPLKIVADKATWKHRTRHFIMAITIVPDSKQLIHPIYLGHPIIKMHNGESVAASILDCITQWDISKQQYIGGSFDGQYFNLSVPEHLNQHFAEEKENDKTFFYDWDPMHKAGLVDERIRKNSKFSWVQKLSQTVISIFNEFNYGKDYEKLKDSFEMSTEGATFKNPCFFSETRFGNYSKRVYLNFREDFKAIITVLEETQVHSLNENSKQRDKATTANTNMNRIFNVQFCLRLSGLCDFYNQFSKIISNLQKVEILPYERYDSFIVEVEHLKLMSSSVELQKCNCSEKCLWPTYHADLKSLSNDQTYQGVHLFLSEPENLNNTRHKAKKAKTDINCDKLLVKVQNELEDISLHAAEELISNVFTREDAELIQHVKVLTDLKLLATKIKIKGVSITTETTKENFLTSTQKLVYDLREVSPDELQMQYKHFLEKIEGVVKDLSDEEFKELTSIDLIKTFLSSKCHLFTGIELVLHSVSVAAIISTVESVCESLTSVYEFHNNKLRPVSEETAHHEMMVSINGPVPTKCDSVVAVAMSNYFAKQTDWHFVRRNHNLKDWTVSKSIDRLLSENSPLPFMDV